MYMYIYVSGKANSEKKEEERRKEEGRMKKDEGWRRKEEEGRWGGEEEEEKYQISFLFIFLRWVSYPEFLGFANP